MQGINSKVDILARATVDNTESLSALKNDKIHREEYSSNPVINQVLKNHLPFNDYDRCEEFLGNAENNVQAQNYVIEWTDTYQKGSTKFVFRMVSLLCSNAFRKCYLYPVKNR